MPDNRTQQQKELGWLLIDTAMKNIVEKNSGFADDNWEGGDLSNEYSCIAACLDNCSVQVPALSGQALQDWLTDLLDNPENPDNECVTEEYDANCVTSGTGCIPLVLPGQVSNNVVIPNQQQLTTLISNYLESRQESYEIQVRTIYTNIGQWTDKWITNQAITFNNYFIDAATEKVLPSVDWWQGGPIFNKLYDAAEWWQQFNHKIDNCIIEGCEATWNALSKAFNSSSTVNAKSGASIFGAEVRKLSPDQVFQVPTPLSDNSVGYWGLTTHFATPTNQQKTDMGETMDGFLDEQPDSERPFESVYAPCCGGTWCSSLNCKSDTARRKERELKTDKHNMEKGNYVEAYLLEGERNANIDALLEDNGKTSPNVEIDPAAYSAELAEAAAGVGIFGSWFKGPDPLTPTQQLTEILNTMGKGNILKPYNVTLTNGEVTTVTTKLLNKSVTFRKSSGGLAAEVCAAAEEKILRNQVKSWGGEAFSPNFYKEGAPGFLEYANGTKWTGSQSPDFCKIFVKDEFGKVTLKEILNGDLFALCKKIQATINANTAKSAAAIAAAVEEGTLLNLSEEFSDVNLLDDPNVQDAGSTLGREEVHVPSRKQGPQAIQHDFDNVSKGSGMCEKPKPENCKSRSVKTVINLDGDPNQRLEGFVLEDSSPAETKRAVDADKVLKAQTTDKGIAKPVVNQPEGLASKESAACRNKRKFDAGVAKVELEFQEGSLKFGTKYKGNIVWRAESINALKRSWKQVNSLALTGMGMWLAADYIAQKNALADQLSEATGINRLKKAADAYNCETDAGVKRIVDEWVRNNPGFSPQPNVSCSTRYVESGCSVCSECKNNCGTQVLRSCMRLQSGKCASDRKCLYVDALTTCTTAFYQNVNDSGCIEDPGDYMWWFGQSVPLRKANPTAVEEFWNDPPKYFPW